jgi:hypothetical protein
MHRRTITLEETADMTRLKTLRRRQSLVQLNKNFCVIELLMSLFFPPAKKFCRRLRAAATSLYIIQYTGLLIKTKLSKKRTDSNVNFLFALGCFVAEFGFQHFDPRAQEVLKFILRLQLTDLQQLLNLNFDLSCGEVYDNAAL